jgi:hypothetical protein
MRNEIINGSPIRVYDSGEGPADRYTVVYMNRKDYGYGTEEQYLGRKLYPCLSMSASPFHPQGIGMHSDAVLGKHLGKRILFASLPEDCQKAVLQDVQEESCVKP